MDIDPQAMRAHGVNVAQIMQAIKKSNLDIGARTLEFNRVEYLVRALGYIENLEALEERVVSVNNHVPIRLPRPLLATPMGPPAGPGHGHHRGSGEASIRSSPRVAADLAQCGLHRETTREDFFGHCTLSHTPTSRRLANRSLVGSNQPGRR